MKTNKHLYCLLVALAILVSCTNTEKKEPFTGKQSFNRDWKFCLGDTTNASWRGLNLPHDWSIEGEFDENAPAGVGGGALPGGLGWYKKSFSLTEEDLNKIFYIDFDGVYMNSEVWINGHYLGKRPNGYISFRYDLTPYLHFGHKKNELLVKVDNSQQPNSRWYSGSGIYRNVWLVKTGKLHIDHWGTYVTTPKVSVDSASVSIATTVRNDFDEEKKAILTTTVAYQGKILKTISDEVTISPGKTLDVTQKITVDSPILWSVEEPEMYEVLSEVTVDEEITDRYKTPFGIRSFTFDVDKGFILNGKQLKIKGVCLHHDLGALGSAVNTRAIERQLEIMKEMGVNGIRTSHNPPAPELLDLCDQMGFIVMDEAFDMWEQSKTKFDYSNNWEKWHKKDLEDLIKRDRNHPSVFMWSIGNEIPEQWRERGAEIAVELSKTVKTLDATRPITAAMNPPNLENAIAASEALDVIGYNYAHKTYEPHKEMFPGKPFIATETTSALETRGYYDMPSDTVKIWPVRWDLVFTGGNPDNTVSAYDQVRAPWGSTHEETWKIIKKHDYLSGMYVWTGFDYIGEPTPYIWPSRSSYFGIVDLAGFPKDVYYMYQSEWTDKPVLHVFPHWNWEEGQDVDIWVYCNNADEVELFLNGRSLGTKSKEGDDLHLMWRIPFEPGTLKAISRKEGNAILEKEIKTAGEAAQIRLTPDRQTIFADGSDLSYVTVEILDENGVLVPGANNLMEFTIEGNGKMVGVDNGDPTSHESFKAKNRKAFYGKCLVIVQSGTEPGDIVLKATAPGLEEDEIIVNTR